MIKGYKIRIYPTKEQEKLLWKHIHACRFIWNYMLELKENNYKNNGIYLRQYDMIRLLTSLKQQDKYLWLKEVSNTSLQRTCTDLSESYNNFYKGITKHPKFKSRKKSKKSFPVRTDVFRFKNEDIVIIEKFREVKIRKTKIPQGKISNVRINLINNKWILSFGVECENQAMPKLTDKSMGIDLGIRKLAVVAYDDQQLIFNNINKSKRIRTLEHKLKHLQRTIMRKYHTNGNWEKSNNIERYEKIIKEIYYKLSNIRQNYIHQITHQLVNLLPKQVIMENLDVSKMLEDHHKAKLISEEKFYEFKRQMKYKCERNGIEFIQADMWFPSSKLCSRCGNKKKYLSEYIRIYKCDQCGLVIDRDYNAAINLMRYVSQNERLTA